MKPLFKQFFHLLLILFFLNSFSISKIFSQCSGLVNLTLATDVISDGSGYNDYSNDLDCQWLIQPSGAQYIYLEFTELNTEEDFDIVYIYNGTTTADPLIGSYSGYAGSGSRPKILVESSSVLVRFATNSTTTDGGFKIEYEGVSGAVPTINTPTVSSTALCPNSSVTVNFTTTGLFCTGENLTNSFKVILSDEDGTFDSGTKELGSGTSSPITFTIPDDINASNLYRIRIESRYPEKISADNGANLVLNNLDLNITTTDASTFVATGSGGVEPYQYSIDGTNFSTTNQFTGLEAGNDYTIYLRDANNCEYSLTFTFNPPLACNSLLAAGGQGTTFTTHHLGSIPGKVFVSYEMYPNPDQMDIYYDGNLVASTNSLVSNTGALSFDYNPAANGPFHCVIRIYAPNSGTRWDYVAGCPIPNGNQSFANNTLSTCAVTLVSPGYPNNYPDNANVTQTFIPTDNTKTLKYSFEFIGTKSNDEISVYDGLNVQSELLGTYSGYSYRPTSKMGFAKNTDGALTFQFISNSYTNGDGFVINAECVDKSEGINVLSSAQVTTCDYYVSTSNYPENYDNNTDIIQTFTPAIAGNKLFISFLDFETETSDNVYIYDGANTSATLLATYDDKYLPANVYATNDAGQLTIHFKSDGYVTSKGFLAQVKCYSPDGFISYNIPGQITETVIDNTNNKIYVNLPDNTNLTSLIATFEIIEGSVAKVNSVIQSSGVTANDFTNPVVYSVSTSGGSTQNWEISVNSNTVNGPIAEFSADATTVDEGTDVTFTDLSTNTPTSWNWTFGDGGTSTEQNPVHTYTTAGTYTVALAVANNDGSDTETKDAYIIVNSSNSAPVAEFEADVTSISVGGTVSFTDLSTNSPTSWNWNFGDNQIATLQNPTHTYSTAGVYTITLEVSNANGTDSEVKTNYITVTDGNAVPDAEFTASSTTVAVGGTVSFTDLTTNNPISWYWEFGDGGTSNEQNPNYTYNTAGIYSVKLIATNINGSDTENKENYITVSADGLPPECNFDYSNTNISVGQSVLFTDISKNLPTSWLWDFGDGQTSTEQHPYHIYLIEGTYTVSLTVSNEFGSDDLSVENLVTVTSSAYCDASATGEFEYISGVELGDIVNNGTIRSEDGYQSYIEMMTVLENGKSYDISIELSFYRAEDITGCWIDWNQDLDFTDENESIALSDAEDNVVTGAITVPDGALTGSTRMRVRVTNSDFNELEPCKEHDFGETEDYTVYVSIVESIGSIDSKNELSIYPNPTSGEFSIEIPENICDATLGVFTLDGKEIFNQNLDEKTTKKITLVLTDLTKGVYIVKLQSDEELYTQKLLIK
jgi:PKD repeat protein